MRALFSIVVLLLLVAVWLGIRARQHRDSSGKRSDPKIYFASRDMVLQGSRARFGLPSASKPAEPWGLLMDWGGEEGTATVVAIADGSASVYLSSGGRFIGGGESHDSIRAAAKRTVELAKEVQPLMQLTTTYPLPQNGHMTFYVLTDAGIFTATVSDEEIETHKSPLYKLGDSVQMIMTEYRIVQQGN